MTMNLGNSQSLNQSGLIVQLQKIQRHAKEEIKFVQLVKQLEVLTIPQATPRKRKRGSSESSELKLPKMLDRRPLGSRKTFVAVSYPWNPSTYGEDGIDEDSTTGTWKVKSREEDVYVETEVRDVVFDRLTTYTREICGLDTIWIDRECVIQKPKDYLEERKKKTLVQSMDLIYKYASHSVALLVKGIGSWDELKLFRKFYNGQFVDKSSGSLEDWVNRETADELIDLLHHIISDKWWTRAWTFQEAHCSGKMHLLIPHSSSRKTKEMERLFGAIPGELDIPLWRFRTAATQFIKAYSGEAWGSSQKCEKIKVTAGQYTDSLKDEYDNYPRAMTGAIFDALASRKITNEWDFLPIAANCCRYSTRLNTERLQKGSYSLSQCIFALFFLNGEIFREPDHESDGPVSMSTLKESVQFLQRISFNKFQDVPLKGGQLSFLKQVRFVEPKLSAQGIVSSGRLWKLYKIIETGTQEFDYAIRQYESHEDATEMIHQLATILDRNNYIELLGSLLWHFSTTLPRPYHYWDIEDRLEYQDPPSGPYMEMMADSLIKAIAARKCLKLGALYDPDPFGCNSYSAIFIDDQGDFRKKRSKNSPHLAFTAWKAACHKRETVIGEPELDNFVSLEVELVDNTGMTPEVKATRWINGLCFFNACSLEDVTFSWPEAIR